MVDPVEVTYIGVKNPYGGFGLRARAPATALARVQRLLEVCATDVVFRERSLSVKDECGRALAEAVTMGPLDVHTAYATSCRFDEPTDRLIERLSHTPGTYARDAWERFGPPIGAEAYQSSRGAFRVGWLWETEAKDGLPEVDLEPYLEFLYGHPHVYGEHDAQVHLRCRWFFRLAGAGDEYPRSEVSATLTQRWSSAFLHLVFPHPEPDDDFAARYEQVCAALKMKLSPATLRVVSPTRAGGEKWRKLPPWRHG